VEEAGYVTFISVEPGDNAVTLPSLVVNDATEATLLVQLGLEVLPDDFKYILSPTFNVIVEAAVVNVPLLVVQDFIDTVCDDLLGVGLLGILGVLPPGVSEFVGSTVADVVTVVSGELLPPGNVTVTVPELVPLFV
jgi:hypothetical protein